MRKLLWALVLTAAIVGLVGWGAGEARAQVWSYYGPTYYPPAYYSYYQAPTYYYAPPYTYNYGYRLSPYGYRTYANYATYPDAFGNYYYQYRYNYARPFYTGPGQSLYWSPYQNRYIYGPGYARPYYYGY
jgi:hypothetical protein